MSRCFPYPPPGYSGSRANDDALILSIKQQRERPKSEKKKDRKREKKRDEQKVNEILCSEKKLADQKLHLADKHGETLNELMEKSSLTEEHGKPCSSSESTENSTNRKRQSLIPTSSNTRNQGTVIRFRLSSQKKEDRPTTSSNHAAPCSTSGRPDFETQKADACLKQCLTPSLDIPFSGPNKEAPPCPVKDIHKTSTTKDEVKLPKALKRYRAIFDNWAPPLKLETVADDQGWLFSGKREVSQPAKKTKFCKEEVPNLACHYPWQPRAQLLADVDIYALPYTVPF